LIFKDDDEYACFEGQSGTLMVELKNPILLKAIDFKFNEIVAQSKPKAIVIYVS
jgi:hypothetical protein